MRKSKFQEISLQARNDWEWGGREIQKVATLHVKIVLIFPLLCLRKVSYLISDSSSVISAKVLVIQRSPSVTAEYTVF